MAFDYAKFFSGEYPIHWQQARNVARGDTSNLPGLLHFEIHPAPPGQCFNKCIYCVGGLTVAPGDSEFLSADVMIAACRDAVSLGARQIVVSSNSAEPLLDEEVSKVIEFLQRETDVRTGVHTCGRNLDTICQSITIASEERSYLSVGLDAVHEATYQMTKRPSPRFGGHNHACRRVISNIEALCTRKSKHQSGPFVSLSVQLTQENSSKAALTQLLEFGFATPGINQIRFATPLPPTGMFAAHRQAFVRNVCLAPADLRSATDYITRSGAELRTAARNPQLMLELPERPSESTQERAYRHCANQLLFATLGPDSYIYPCTTVTATQLGRRLIRFSREGDLKRFWHSRQRKALLWFDVGRSCQGFDCTRCEHCVNNHFNRAIAVRETSFTKAASEAAGPG